MSGLQLGNQFISAIGCTQFRFAMKSRTGDGSVVCSNAPITDVDIKGEFGGKIVENAARKVLNKYVPPIARVEDIDSDQAVVVIPYKETTNLSGIQPHPRFVYELNCSGRMMRRLSTYVRLNGRDGFDDQPSGWEYVPPEGTSATLPKILCPKL